MTFDTSGLRAALGKLIGKFEPFEDVFTAVYVSDNSDGTHEVDFLQPDGSTGPRRTVRGRVIAWAGVIVRISVDRQRYGPEEYVIIGVDESGYGSAPAPSMLEKHGPLHSYNGPDEIPNLDTFQLTPLRVQPNAGLIVRIQPGIYYADGEYHQLDAAINLDMTAYLPAAGWKWAVISIDAAGALTVTEGPDVAFLLPEDIPDAPIGERALCAVQMNVADVTMTRARLTVDLRYMVGSVGSGGGGSALWENVVIVAEAGGQFTTINGAEGWRAANDAIVMMPGTYSENVAITTDGPLIAAWGADTAGNAIIDGADDIGPIVDFAVGRAFKGPRLSRTLAAGAGEFTALDANQAGVSPEIGYCRIDLDDGPTGRDLTGLDVSGAADTVYIVHTRINLIGSGTNRAIRCNGGTIVIQDCEIVGDIVCDAATTLVLRNCSITGNITGMAGCDLIIGTSTYITGVVTAFDSVAGHFYDGSTSILEVFGGIDVSASTAAAPVAVLQTTDDDATNPILEIQDSGGVMMSEIEKDGNLNFTTGLAANPGMIEVNDTRFFHTYGTDNLFIGLNSGNFTLTLYKNLGVGEDTLSSLTSGYQNVAVGLRALSSVTEGYSNVAVGFEAARDLTTGTNNFALGVAALQACITGDENMAIGTLALKATNGTSNTAIGYSALRACTTGSENVAIGGYSIYRVTEGDDNVSIGVASGSTITTGNRNICIGRSAGQTTTTGSDNITIGYDIDPSAAGANSELNIGGIIFGDLSVPDVRLGDRAANHVKVDNNGNMSFEGTATVWNDIYFSMSSGKIGGANQPTWAAFQGNTMEYTFAINDYIHLPTQEIAHSYKEGSDISLHVHIVLDGSDAGDTDVNYEIEYTIGDLNEVMSAAAVITSGDFTITGGTADRTHLRIEIGDIVGTNLLAMSALKMRFRRIALVGGGNAPSNDPFVLMVGAHIEEDTVGSRTETAK